MAYIYLHTLRVRRIAFRLALAAVLLGLCWSRPAQATTLVHVVQSGQNLGMIAKRYHTSVQAIERRNRLKPGHTLRVGQRLRIDEVEEHRKWRRFYEQKLSPKKATQKAPAAKTPAAKTPATKTPATKPAPKPAAPTRAASKRAPEARPEPRKAPSRSTSSRHKGRSGTTVPSPSSRRGTSKPAAKTGSSERGDSANAKRHPRKEATTLPLYQQYARKPRRKGHVNLVRYSRRFRGQLINSRGKLVPNAALKVDGLLRSRRTGESHPINRRLVKLLGQVSDHFGGRTIVLVSGFRPYSPKQYTRNSRHNHGKAVDFRVAGVPNRALFEYCRTLRNVGCGYYPNSVFVHMDVRRYTTQWTDFSRPGQKPIYAHRLRQQAAASKAAASGTTATAPAAATPTAAANPATAATPASAPSSPVAAAGTTGAGAPKADSAPKPATSATADKAESAQPANKPRAAGDTPS